MGYSRRKEHHQGNIRPPLGFVSLCSASILALFVLVWLNHPNLPSHLYHYLSLSFSELTVSHTDSSSSAQDRYTLHLFQTKYREKECEGLEDSGRSVWVTSAFSEDDVVKAVVLGRAIDKLSCYRTKVVVIGDEVSKDDRAALGKAGYSVEVVPNLSCSGSKEWHSHSTLQVFNLTRFEKIIYLSGNMFPVLSLDHMFDLIKPDTIYSPRCSPTGVFDPCFTPELFGIVPNSPLLSDLLSLWQTFSYFSCPDLPTLLHYQFAYQNSWVSLPYIYNTRATLPDYPARVYHFPPRDQLPPWEWQGKPTRKEAASLSGSFASHLDVYRLWWKYHYEGLEKAGLWHWWHGTQVYKRFLHSDPLRDFRAVDIW